MKILYYDCFAGISGDMNLAAMIDLGVDPDSVKAELSKLNLDDEFELHVSRDKKQGISGTRVDVLLKELKHHSHHSHHSHHRNIKTIESLILDSGLKPQVKQTAMEIFTHVAVAEAKVHGKKIEEVHFHEVGATDSIVDIVGAALCYHELKVDKVLSRPIELGSGFVRCAHGRMPVPAPATAEIVKDIPTTLGAVTSEATTPTGAAILKSLVDEFRTGVELTIRRSGYGLGHRDAELPNVLRVFLADSDR